MRALLVIVGFAWLGALGCMGGDHPPVYPVTGVVTWNDKPVAGAEVAFHPTAETTDANPARGVTDAAGRYYLQTFFAATEDVAGCRPGDYLVSITKIEQPMGIVDPYSNPEALKVKHLIPSHYADAKTSQLKATVEAKAMQFDYQLKDAP